MIRLRNLLPFLCGVVAWLPAPGAPAATLLAAEPDALARAMNGPRIVVLGEVHDNGAQHALRLAALKIVVAQGARPALAFEQFDRERQPDIDRARRERPRDADHVIREAKGSPNWNWKHYRPFVQLALDHDLPIVAANLSRGGAMTIAQRTAPATAPKLPEAVVRAHEDAIAKGHCNLLPAEALPGMALAQIARDRTLAESIRPYAARGVVLLTGNGHARIDIGVPFWLTPEERAASVAIGLLERDETGSVEESPAMFDAYARTERAERADPCDELRARLRQLKPKADGGS
jgi:uncharacterized iron-regulated protein